MNPRANPVTGSGKLSGNETVRKWAVLALKIAVSVSALAFLLTRMDLSETLGLLAGSGKPMWSLALIFLVVSQAVTTLRWRILLVPYGFILPRLKVLKIYWVGLFFSLFLPGIVGGDVVKTYYVAGSWRAAPTALFTLIADRTVGVAGMLVYAAVGLAFTFRALPPWLAAGVGAMIALFYPVLIYLPRLSVPLLSLVKKLRDVPRDRLFLYWQDPVPAIKGWDYLLLYPLTSLAAFIPLSLNGIGLREAAYVYILGRFGVAPEPAFSLALMWFSIILANGLLGGGVYILGGRIKGGENYSSSPLGERTEVRGEDRGGGEKV